MLLRFIERIAPHFVGDGLANSILFGFVMTRKDSSSVSVVNASRSFPLGHVSLIVSQVLHRKSAYRFDYSFFALSPSIAKMH